MFEIVHTITDWYDGPRRGIADYHGQPHLFEYKWQDGEDLDADTFLLMPITSETLILALEDWAIWRRWRMAFDQKATNIETHPALPQDRSRHEELKRMLEGRLVIDPSRALQRQAHFRANHDLQSPKYEVCWAVRGVSRHPPSVPDGV